MTKERYKNYRIGILKDCNVEWYELPQNKTMRQIKRHIDEVREANKKYHLDICIWLAKIKKVKCDGFEDYEEEEIY